MSAISASERLIYTATRAVRRGMIERNLDATRNARLEMAEDYGMWGRDYGTRELAVNVLNAYRAQEREMLLRAVARGLTR